MTLGLLWGVWAAINVTVFALYGVDKRRAIRGAWRIPEKTLLTGTWLLGGVGAWMAMRIFRHKTRHMVFRVSASIGAAISLTLMLLASARLLNAI